MKNLTLFFLVCLIVLNSCKSGDKYQPPSPEELQLSRLGDHGDFLKNSKKLEIYSIHSTASEEPSYPIIDEGFHKFNVYGKTSCTVSDDIEAVWGDLKSRVFSKMGSNYTYCFWPRHGIRAYNGDEVRDYLICFECDHLYVYNDIHKDEYERIPLEMKTGDLRLNILLDNAGVSREKGVY